jgi:hypothetical protein
VWRKISAHVDGGPSGGSSVRRPGSEDPIGMSEKFYMDPIARLSGQLTSRGWRGLVTYNLLARLEDFRVLKLCKYLFLFNWSLVQSKPVRHKVVEESQ